MTAAFDWQVLDGTSLPGFTAAEARAHRMWARQGLRFPSGSWQLTQADRLEDPFGKTGRFRIVYQVGIAGQRITFDVGDDAYSILLADVIGQTQPELLDPTRASLLSLGVVAYRARGLVASRLESLGLTVTLDLVNPCDGGLVIGATALPRAVDLWLTASCPVSGVDRNGAAALHVPWSMVAACLPRTTADRARRVERAVGSYRAVVAELAVGVGIARLSADELRGLRVGDAMPLQGFTDDIGSESDASGVPLLLPGTAVRLVLHGGGVDGASCFGWDGVVLDGRRPLRIKLGHWCPRLNARSSEVNVTGEGPADVDGPPNPEQGPDEMLGVLADEVPIELVAEIGRLSMPLSELAGLHAGQVIAFERNLHEPVRLTANGQFVATGRLMQSHGRIGVQVVSLPGGHAGAGTSHES